MCSCSSVSWTIWDSFEFWRVGGRWPFSIFHYLVFAFSLWQSIQEWQKLVWQSRGGQTEHFLCQQSKYSFSSRSKGEKNINDLYSSVRHDWSYKGRYPIELTSIFLQTRLGEYCYKYTNILAKQSWPDCEESFRLDKIRKLYNFIEMQSFNLSQENFIATHQEIPDRNLDLDKIILIRT